MADSLRDLVQQLRDHTNCFYKSNSNPHFLPSSSGQLNGDFKALCHIQKSKSTEQNGRRNKRNEHVKKMFFDPQKAFSFASKSPKTSQEFKAELTRMQTAFLKERLNGVSRNELQQALEGTPEKQIRYVIRTEVRGKASRRQFETYVKRLQSFIRFLVEPEVAQANGQSTDHAGNSGFGGFKKEAFELLQKFKDQPTKECYLQNKAEFESELKSPMAALFQSMGPKFEEIFGPAIETKRWILSNIQKNDYGKGGIHGHYWGAFYPTGMKRTSSAQLFVFLHPDGIRFGFAFGNYSEKAIKDYLRRAEAADFNWHSYFSALGAKGVTLARDYNSRNDSTAAVTPTFDEFRKLLLENNAYPVLALHLKPQQLVALGAELANQIADILLALIPIFSVASFEDFGTFIKRWDDAVDGGDDLEGRDGDILFETAGPPPEEYWRLFLEEMNWNEKMEEALALKSIYDGLTSSEKERTDCQSIILYGPPGSGKSMAAAGFAEAVATSPLHIRKVQFHQSYSYENFIEGIRPVTSAGSLTYDIVPGPFAEFCNLASEKPDERFVFVIDEINRGNMSKIFGELLYLLEYRDEELPLMYSQKKFSIPQNVLIIGTMNTADRSIALVDFAMRRRFKFVEIAARAEIICEYYGIKKTDQAIRFFDFLNGKVGSRNLHIGHSYFIKPHLESDGLTKDDLAQVWSESVFPLLEEYFGGSPKIEDFSKDFEAFWSQFLTAEERRKGEKSRGAGNGLSVAKELPSTGTDEN